MAGKISDRELRLRALKLTNAYDQPGIIQRPLAIGDRLIDIINIYEHEHWPNEKVYCSQCNGHHHRKGFTVLVLTVAGSLVRMLLGSKCGAQAFDESWEIAKRRIEEQHKRQWELARLDRLETVSKELMLSLETWRARVPAVVGRKSAFWRAFGELASRLIEAHDRNQGRFFVDRTVNLKNGTQAIDTQLLEKIPGWEIFNSLDMISTIDCAIQALKSMARSIGMSDTVRTDVLRTRRRTFEDTFEGLLAVAVMYSGAQEFFTAHTFAKIADWTQRYAVTKNPYDWTGRKLVNKDGWEEFALPNPFPDLGDEPLDLIVEYRRSS